VNEEQHELTVTITLSEYRYLLEKKFEATRYKEKLDWSEQYTRANKAEQKVKELTEENNKLVQMVINKQKSTEGCNECCEKEEN
jgi:hypothetical protein